MSKLIVGDCRDVMRKLIAEGVRVQMCVTSPPYWGLRDYGVAGQLGLESTPQEYVANMVEVFRLVRELLADDGTLWLNLGDSYARDERKGQHKPGDAGKQNYIIERGGGRAASGTVLASRSLGGVLAPQGQGTLKAKDLVGIPWRVAFALQADGWYLRQDIIWCLSGGTVVYARTQKGDMPMTLKDMARLDPATVQLWNGERWTQLLGMSKARRRATELTLVLRSGERISCTPTHKFPTARGLLDASEIRKGDQLIRARLPEPDAPKSPAYVSDDAAWFAGLYLAEGSMAGDTIQIAGHAKEAERWNRLQRIAAAYGGSATCTVHGNSMDVRLYGKLLVGLVRELVSGKTAINKHIAPAVWRYSDRFLAEYLRGYLDGDGHWEEGNQRWRLGFCRNYALEQDLRTACARLGWMLTLRPGTAKYQGGARPSFRGELRAVRSGHHNERSRDDVVRIECGRCRWVYDVGVADDPHLFALASGILTHNSKPNPMPESVRDRCTKAHEYLFLLAKRERYYYDHKAIAEESSPEQAAHNARYAKPYDNEDRITAGQPGNVNHVGIHSRPGDGTRNKRSVWAVATQPYSEAHFATFPPALIEPCILAGSRPGDIVFDPFGGSGTTGEVAQRLGRNWLLIELSPEYAKLAETRTSGTVGMQFAEASA